MDSQFVFTAPSSEDRALHLLSGSFKSLSLYLLAFSPINRTLDLVHQTGEQFGPHQYLAYHQGKAYSTSWAEPSAILSSWEVQPEHGKIHHLQNVPITAVSSYITIPPPFTHIYSVGGPTGEIHQLKHTAGDFGAKIQEILFVPSEDLEHADKTRKALRTGSHGIEFCPSTSHAFVPVLGSSTIEMYHHDKHTGLLTHISSSPSPRGKAANDGPRHVKVHPNGKILYSVTEHSNHLDIYRILPTSLEYSSSRSIIPDNLRNTTEKFRGDTLSLLPSTPAHPIPNAIFTTTRGADSSVRGWMSVFKLDEQGLFSSDDGGLEQYETPTSGGKANAIDLLPKAASGEGVWIALTDDSEAPEAALRILEWNGWHSPGIKEVAAYPQPGGQQDSGEQPMRGASHAIWIQA